MSSWLDGAKYMRIAPSSGGSNGGFSAAKLSHQFGSHAMLAGQRQQQQPVDRAGSRLLHTQAPTCNRLLLSATTAPMARPPQQHGRLRVCVCVGGLPMGCKCCWKTKTKEKEKEATSARRRRLQQVGDSTSLKKLCECVRVACCSTAIGRVVNFKAADCCGAIVVAPSC